MNFLQKKSTPVLILITLCLIVYINSLGNEFVSDDIASILQNPQIRSLDYVLSHLHGFVRPLWYFLVSNTLGLEPWGYRIFNILCHIGSVISLYLIVKKLKDKKIAFIAAALFAVHPVLVESVSWISGGIYAQTNFFLLLTFYLYLKSVEKGDYYLWSLVTYCFGLFSQVIILVFLPILILHKVSFSKQSLSWGKISIFFLLSLFTAYIYITGASSRSYGLQTDFYQEKGIDNPALVVPIGVTKDLELMLFPKDLTLYHSELVMTPLEYSLRGLVLLILLCLVAYLYFKNRYVFFWSGVFLVSLAPTLGPAVFRLTWIVAERYLYLGTAAFMAIVAYALVYFSNKYSLQKVLIIFLSVLISLLSVRTILRNNDWRTADDLWLSAAPISPNSPNNHNNLGDLYGRRGDQQRAIQEFKTAISIKPNYGDAYHNLANTYQEIGQYDLAIQNYMAALQFNPNLWQSYENIANIYYKEKNYPQAESFMQKAIQVNPSMPQLHDNLGIVYLEDKKKSAAQSEFNTSLQLDPTDQTAQQGLIEAGK